MDAGRAKKGVGRKMGAGPRFLDSCSETPRAVSPAEAPERLKCFETYLESRVYLQAPCRAPVALRRPREDNLLDLMDTPAPSAPSGGFAPPPAAAQGFNADFGDLS